MATETTFELFSRTQFRDLYLNEIFFAYQVYIAKKFPFLSAMRVTVDIFPCSTDVGGLIVIVTSV